MTQEKLAQYRIDSAKNPVLKVMVALLEEQTGNKKKAITVLDDFAMAEPDLIITPAVKNHIKKLIEEIKQ